MAVIIPGEHVTFTAADNTVSIELSPEVKAVIRAARAYSKVYERWQNRGGMGLRVGEIDASYGELAAALGAIKDVQA